MHFNMSLSYIYILGGVFFLTIIIFFATVALHRRRTFKELNKRLADSLNVDDIRECAEIHDEINKKRWTKSNIYRKQFVVCNDLWKRTNQRYAEILGELRTSIQQLHSMISSQDLSGWECSYASASNISRQIRGLAVEEERTLSNLADKYIRIMKDRETVARHFATIDADIAPFARKVEALRELEHFRHFLVYDWNGFEAKQQAIQEELAAANVRLLFCQRFIGQYDEWGKHVREFESIVQDYPELENFDSEFRYRKNILDEFTQKYNEYTRFKHRIDELVQNLSNQRKPLQDREKIIKKIEEAKASHELSDQYDWAEYEGLKRKVLDKIQTITADFDTALSNLATAVSDENEGECRLLIEECEKLCKKYPPVKTSAKSRAFNKLKENASHIEQRKRVRTDANNWLKSFNNTYNQGDLYKSIDIAKEAHRYKNILPASTINEVVMKATVAERNYNRTGLSQEENNTIHVEYAASRGLWHKNPYDWTHYPGIFYPEEGSIVFPFRRRKIGRRGYSEESFQSSLSGLLAPGFEVIGDASIHLADGCRPYEPDIAVIDRTTGLNIRIDIEIDEPYTGLTRKPIHYIGCGDETRDMNLTRAGWIVVRFSEQEVVKRRWECIARIQAIIKNLYPSVDFPSPSPTPIKFHKCPRWTKNEALIAAANYEREKYLGIDSFGVTDDEEACESDIVLTEKERELARHLEQPTIVRPQNLDQSIRSFENDEHLIFNPEDHTYFYDGYRELKPVSTVVSSWFPEFESIEIATAMSQRDGSSPEYFLTKWDRKGAMSREVGTFMHQQIERILKHKTIKTDYIFEYGGQTEAVNIDEEIHFFKSFISENHISPFRSEWPICDLNHNIAGTIDCLCKNSDGTFDIYDWKRTDKVIDPESEEVIQLDRYGKTAFAPLNYLDDCRFFHYALQQNLYRYMLEKNYGLQIRKMHLVILHPSYDSYKKVTVPKMDSEVRTILSKL